MTDAYITLAWLLKDPLDRARKYIDHGLGQEKLLIEHYRAEIEEMKDELDKEGLVQAVKAQESWLNSQHFSFLQTVNVGSWSGTSTRKMAEEAGCMDLYRFAYTPYSSCAHNIWNHIGKFCCRHSTEPLHKFIRQPFLADMPIHPSVFLNSAKYYQKALKAVATKYSVPVLAELPYDWANEAMEGLAEGLAKQYSTDVEGSNHPA